MSEEYYSAGQMVWLAVDARLRALNRGRRSLDDFARAYRTVSVDYPGGLQYPHLVRVKGTPDYLGRIIAPRTR